MATEQEHARSDLTARARIRDAALDSFSEQGFASTTIRGVATRAEVSPALVQHHFATKGGLRAACDAYVVEFIRKAVEQGLSQGYAGEPEFVSTLYRAAPRRMRYIARSLVDGTPAGAEVFDNLVAVTENYLAERTGEADSKSKAVLLTAMRLGVTVLGDHVSRNLGESIFEPEPAARAGTIILELLAPTLLPEGESARINAALRAQVADPGGKST